MQSSGTRWAFRGTERVLRAEANGLWRGTGVAKRENEFILKKGWSAGIFFLSVRNTISSEFVKCPVASVLLLGVLSLLGGRGS